MQFQFSIFSCLRQAESWHNSVNGWCDVEQSWTDGKRVPIPSKFHQIPGSWTAIYLHQLCNDNAKVKSFELSLAKPAVGSMRKRMKLPSCAQFGVSVLVPATGDTLFQTVTCHKEDSVEFTRRVISPWFAEFKRWTNCWTWKQVKHGETTGLWSWFH